MSAVQYVAVKADTKKTAVERACLLLEDITDRAWYNDFAVAGSNDSEVYGFNDADGMIAKLEEVKTKRVDVFNNFYNIIKKNQAKVDEAFVAYNGNPEYSIELVNLKLCMNFIQGEWDINSMFFDLENESTSTENVVRGVRSGEAWFLIPVSFDY